MKKFKCRCFYDGANVVYIIVGSKTTIGKVPAVIDKLTEKFFDDLYAEYCKGERNPVTQKYFEKKLYEATAWFAVRFLTK